jgi:cytochrome bd-type quinol oxidase subunit 2
MNANGLGAFLVGMLICIVVVIAVVLIIQVLFLLTLYRTMKEVRERNREMAPGMVWLTLIPIFAIVWVIIMVGKIATSVRNEFEDRGWQIRDESFGRTVGMLWAWGGVVSVGLSVLQNIAQFADLAPVVMILGVLSLPVSMGILVCFIMYWIQMYQYGKQLRLGRHGYAVGSVEADFDDDFQPRREGEEPFEFGDEGRPRRDDR